ncbi:MAG: 3'(2'),5'-bisphosphate nucleotidase CysQ [Terriglobia bacterium]
MILSTAKTSGEAASSGTAEIIGRIREALEAAVRILEPYAAGGVAVEYKSPRDPVTAADYAVDDALHQLLPLPGEGWLSEESADDLTRLSRDRVWVVDPLDGTREFVAGLPEWCVSIACVEHSRAVAGGIVNPATGETFLGAIEAGLLYNDKPARASDRGCLSGALVLASRSEVKRGDWERFTDAAFSIQPTGSVAYKLARVAAGLADATWTLAPKHEWDVAAGVALVEAAGGFVQSLSGSQIVFNNEHPVLSGLIAGGESLRPQLVSLLKPYLTTHTRR